MLKSTIGVVAATLCLLANTVYAGNSEMDPPKKAQPPQPASAQKSTPAKAAPAKAVPVPDEKKKPAKTDKPA